MGTAMFPTRGQTAVRNNPVSSPEGWKRESH